MARAFHQVVDRAGIGAADRAAFLGAALEHDQGALLLHVQRAKCGLLSIEIHIEDGEVFIFRLRGQRLDDWLLRVASGAPGRGNVNEDGLSCGLGSGEGRFVEGLALGCKRCDRPTRGRHEEQIYEKQSLGRRGHDDLLQGQVGWRR
jgi:hypothetical protein